MADPDSSIQAVAHVVMGDPGLAARVLALANSAAFGLTRQVTELHQAVALVGANTCQTLAIAGSCNLLDGSSGLGHVRDHALRVACAARQLADRAGLNVADAFAAGLLHDLGEILLWRDAPQAYAEEAPTWSDVGQQLRAERGRFGTDHALVAREQLSAWQLPGHVVDAVGDHHRPDLHHRDLSTLVIAAEELADDDAPWSSRLGLFGVDAADLDQLRSELWSAVEELGGLLSAA